jgi:hypothetical protein
VGSVFNLNDCAVFGREEARRIKRSIGHVDVLSTQFSISAWDGNPEAVERRRAGARTMLARAVMHCEEFAPRFVMPFASFIWFCHEENAYMNDAFLGIDEVERTLRTRSATQPIVMYPGDEWLVGTSHDSASAVARYLADQASIATKPLIRSTPVPPDELMAASRTFCRDVLEGSNALRLRLGRACRAFRDRSLCSPVDVRSTVRRCADLLRLRVARARIYVPDHRQSYVLSLEAGLRPAAFEPWECDVAVSAGALLYTFKFLWGGQTLQINGRFREIRPEGRRSLFEIFAVAGWRKSGHTVRWSSIPLKAAQLAKRLHVSEIQSDLSCRHPGSAPPSTPRQRPVSPSSSCERPTRCGDSKRECDAGPAIRPQPDISRVTPLVPPGNVCLRNSIDGQRSWFTQQPTNPGMRRSGL